MAHNLGIQGGQRHKVVDLEGIAPGGMRLAGGTGLLVLGPGIVAALGDHRDPAGCTDHGALCSGRAESRLAQEDRNQDIVVVVVVVDVALRRSTSRLVEVVGIAAADCSLGRSLAAGAVRRSLGG